MRAERFVDDRIHDQAGNQSAVRVGADDRLVDNLLHDHDDPARGKCDLLLHAEQSPHLGVTLGIGALRVDEGHIRVERGHDGHLLLAVRALDEPDLVR